MNKINSLLGFLTAVMLLSGCGGIPEGGGDLLGAGEREGWVQTLPYGMVYCRPGTFHMGQADQDVPATQINFNKQVTIGGFYMDETEITNNEYRQFMQAITDESELSRLGMDTGTIALTPEYIAAELKPDTTVWMRDFSYHYGDPMMEYYWMHPAFDDYPVVGVDWYAARFFSEWRTRHMNTWREENGMWASPNFRLPFEAEWEYAARGKRMMAKYPWGGPYLRNAKGCMLANFKPGRGNYYDDAFMYSGPVASYFSNDFGLYDMAGNVSEWCEDAFFEASVPVVWDLNPVYLDEAETRKVIRGGSWKDIAYYLETGTRTFEYSDTTKSYVGFRNVMTQLGRSSGFEF